MKALHDSSEMQAETETTDTYTYVKYTVLHSLPVWAGGWDTKETPTGSLSCSQPHIFKECELFISLVLIEQILRE